MDSWVVSCMTVGVIADVEMNVDKRGAWVFLSRGSGLRMNIDSRVSG